jgi:N-acetylneuraminic acid mutarotase
MSKSVALLLVLVFLTASTTVTINSVSAPTINEDSWTIKKSMPTARSGLGVAVINDKIYAIGGVGKLPSFDTNEEYEPVADMWTTRESMLTPRGEFAIAVFQDKIYVFGGAIKAHQWDFELTDVNEVYDPATDTWTAKASMPVPKAGFSASVVDDKIYLIGGWTKSVTSGFGPLWVTSNETLVYDPNANSWTTKTPMPTGAVHYSSAVVDDKIYVISGTSRAYSDNLINYTQIYDPKTDTWSQGALIPAAVQQAAAGATTGVKAPKAIYVVGGFTGLYVPKNLTQVYYPETDTWSFGADMPTPLFSLGVAVVEDKLYAIGGNPFYMQPATNQNSQYTPIANGFVPPPSEQFPTTVLVATIVTVTAIGVGLLVYFKKRRRLRSA